MSEANFRAIHDQVDQAIGSFYEQNNLGEVHSELGLAEQHRQEASRLLVKAAAHLGSAAAAEQAAVAPAQRLADTAERIKAGVDGALQGAGSETAHALRKAVEAPFLTTAGGERLPAELAEDTVALRAVVENCHQANERIGARNQRLLKSYESLPGQYQQARTAAAEYRSSH